MNKLLAVLVAGAVWFLGAWPSAASGGTIRTSDGARLHYTQTGSGPAIVFVPGWTVPGWMWEPQIRHFSTRYRVVAMDPRSQGRSERVTEGHYTERRAQDIKELIDQLGLAPAVVVGHSLAVSELLSYVDQFGTGTLAGLVLVDSSLGPFPKSEEASAFLAWVRQISLDRRRVLEGIVRQSFQKPLPPGYARKLIEDAMSTPTNTAVALLVGSSGKDFRPVIEKVDKPVLYAITPRYREEGERLVASNPLARVEVFENAGHTLYVDEAERFNALLEEFARGAFGTRAGASD